MCQELDALRQHVSNRQLLVTVGSAAIMLIALTVFWNLFILPGHLPENYIGEYPRGTVQSKLQETDKDATEGAEVSQVEADIPKANQEETEKVGGASSKEGQNDDTLNSLPENPDLSLVVKPLEGELIKEFGFAFSPTLKDYRFHGAIDVAAREGTPVKCALAGVVESIAITTREGTGITVNHGGTLRSVYSHLGEVSVEKDARVEAGQVLGLLRQPGSLEAVEGCHLHFELIRDGDSVDPMQYLSY